MQNVTVLASSCSSSTQSLTSKYNTLLHSFFARFFIEISIPPLAYFTQYCELYLCVCDFIRKEVTSFFPQTVVSAEIRSVLCAVCVYFT